MGEHSLCTDNANAERFQRWHKSEVKYIKEPKKWIFFKPKDGWQYADLFRLTKPVVRNIYKEAAVCKDKEDRKGLGDWAHASESRTKQRDMTDIAKDFMSVSISDFDANPYLINCKNGVLNLKTKGLVEHSPDQLHLKKANASYKLDATCPRWIKFLEEIFDNDAQLIKYVHIALGYSIMGLTTEHCFFLCHGNGRNGKGTLLETIGYVLGDYALTAEFDTFLHKDISNVRVKEAKANLKGKRFVIASETSDSTRMNEALIKTLTGGDKLVGAKLYGDNFEFDPTHTIWLACNHMPAIKDATIAMWERVKAIPFIKNFLDEAQDKQLKDTLQQQECDGIFKWLVDGAYEYLQNGLPGTPDVVKQATQEYRDINDKLSIYIRENPIRDGVSMNLLTERVYDDYGRWCIGANETPIALFYFKTNLKERGVEVKRASKGNVLIGYRFRDGR
jgi:putative DNA primase/helicase